MVDSVITTVFGQRHASRWHVQYGLNSVQCIRSNSNYKLSINYSVVHPHIVYSGSVHSHCVGRLGPRFVLALECIGVRV